MQITRWLFMELIKFNKTPFQWILRNVFKSPFKFANKIQIPGDCLMNRINENFESVKPEMSETPGFLFQKMR